MDKSSISALPVVSKVEASTPDGLKVWITITILDQGREFVAEFARSEECGYRPGGLLLDLPNGSHISIRKRSKMRGTQWIETLIHNGIGQRSTTHQTRKAALYSAAASYAAEVLEAEVLAEQQ